MMFFRTLLVALLISSPAYAWIRGAPTGALGHSLIQGSVVTTSSMVNVLKSFTTQYRSGMTPGGWSLDANGYPTANCTTPCTGQYWFASQSSQGMVPGDYYFYLPTGFKTKFTIGVSTACSIVSGPATCVGNTGMTTAGASASVVKLTLPDSQAILVFDNAFNYSGSTGGITMVANRYKTQYETYVGTGDAREYFGQDFLNYITSLNSTTFRFYADISANNKTNNALWAYRTQKEFALWSNSNQNYPPGAWSGGAGTAGTLSYSAVASTGCTATGGSNELYTAAATSDQPSPNPQGLLADPTMASRGITVQGVIPVGTTNATATTKLCWGSGAFPIYDPATGVAIAIGGIVGGATSVADQTMATFVFDPILNSGNGAFLYYKAAGAVDGGISTHLPYDIQIKFANAVRENYWVTIPYLATDDFVTQIATLTKANLSSGLYFYPEYANEVWNNSFYPTKYAIAVAAAMGFSADVHSWYSLRTREMMGNLIPAVFTGSDKARLRRVLGYAGFQSSTVLGNSPFYVTRMKSAQLKSGSTGSGVGSVGQVYCVYTGGVWSGSCSGGADYTLQVSSGGSGRAIDVVEAIAPAPYTGGTNLFYGADNCSACTATAGNAAIWQTIIDAWEGGNTAAAVAIVDDDVRQGRNLVQTVTASGTTFTTPLAHGYSVGNNVSFQWTGGTSYANMNPGVMYCVKSANVSGANTFSIVAASGGLTCNTSGTAFNAGAAGTGTVTVGFMGASGSSINTVSMLTTNNTAHPWAQTLAAQFQSPNETRPAGMSNLRIDQYEGSLEPGVPTTAQCVAAGATSTSPATDFGGTLTSGSPNVTGVSNADIARLMTGMTTLTVQAGTGTLPGTGTISNVYPDRNIIVMSNNATGSGTATIRAIGNCSTSLNLAVFNWKLSASFAATQKLYYDQFMGRDPNMPTYNLMLNAGNPGQLVLGGTSPNPNNSMLNGNQYGLLNGALFGISSTFQNYTGIQQFNAN